MTEHVVVLLIMDMDSAKSDVNGQRKKYAFGVLKKNVTQKSKKMFF